MSLFFIFGDEADDVVMTYSNAFRIKYPNYGTGFVVRL